MDFIWFGGAESGVPGDRALYRVDFQKNSAGKMSALQGNYLLGGDHRNYLYDAGAPLDNNIAADTNDTNNYIGFNRSVLCGSDGSGTGIVHQLPDKWFTPLA